MNILAIDPGSSRSAFVWFEDGAVVRHGIMDNADLLEACRYSAPASLDGVVKAASLDAVVIEQMQSYGMPVGREVFDAVLWSGRFDEAINRHELVPVEYISRPAVKAALCNDVRAKDANVRQALIDRFGGSKAAAIGTKAAPGPLYGIRADEWSALAIAIAWTETHPQGGTR